MAGKFDEKTVSWYSQRLVKMATLKGYPKADRKLGQFFENYGEIVVKKALKVEPIVDITTLYNVFYERKEEVLNAEEGTLEQLIDSLLEAYKRVVVDGEELQRAFDRELLGEIFSSDELPLAIPHIYGPKEMRDFFHEIGINPGSEPVREFMRYFRQSSEEDREQIYELTSEYLLEVEASKRRSFLEKVVSRAKERGDLLIALYDLLNGF